MGGFVYNMASKRYGTIYTGVTANLAAREEAEKLQDNAKAIAKSANAAEKAKPYPLAKCLVSGNDLDSMGGPITKVYNGQEIKFCCKPCIKKFEANQAKYLAKLPK